MLRRLIVLLIAIRPSDGDVKPGSGSPLGAYRQVRLCAGFGFHLLPSLHRHATYNKHYKTITQYNHLNLT